MIDQKLTSHQVFEAVQGGISDSPMRKGKILFANRFTGDPVDMDDDLRAALNHDGTFIGNNPINQLEKALMGVPGGPWYIDVREEVLYIHNLAIDQPATYDYVYGSENGELLKVSFKTQYRNKSVPRGGTMAINQFDKSLEMHSTSQTSDYNIVGDTSDRAAKSLLISKANSAYVSAKLGTMYQKGIFRTLGVNAQTFLEFININLRRRNKKSLGNNANKLYDLSLESLSNWYDSYREYLTNQTTSYREKFEQRASGRDLQRLQRTRSHRIYNSLSEKDLQVGIANFLNQTLGDRTTTYRRVVEDELNKAQRQGPEALSKVLHRYFDNTVYTQYTHDGLNVVECDVADLIKGNVNIPRSLNDVQSNVVFTKSDGRFKQAGEGVSTSTILACVNRYLRSNGYSNITLTPYDVRSERLGSRISCKIKVKCKKYTKNYKKVSGYQLMYDYYTRHTGTPSSRHTQFIRSQATGSNISRKITQKRLEVEMVVVGRPSLTSNAKVKISNVGYRSGEYIIERCIHQITPGEGYTCSLTLTQGVHNEPVGSVDNKVPLSSTPGNSGGGSSRGGGRRLRGDGNGGTITTSPIKPVSIWLTPAERTYFSTLITKEDAVSAQEEFITQVKYSRTKAYQDARAHGKSEAEAREAVRRMNQTGIVTVRHKSISSDNTHLKEKLEPHYNRVPTRYKISYRDEVRAILKSSVDKIKSRVKK